MYKVFSNNIPIELDKKLDEVIKNHNKNIKNYKNKLSKQRALIEGVEYFIKKYK